MITLPIWNDPTMLNITIIKAIPIVIIFGAVFILAMVISNTISDLLTELESTLTRSLGSKHLDKISKICIKVSKLQIIMCYMLAIGLVYLYMIFIVI